MNPEANPIVVLDFGAQYSKLIARRVRETKVFSLILPYSATIDEIKAHDPSAIIFSGGPSSVHAEGSPKCDPAILDLGIPILGICYGAQLIAQPHVGAAFGESRLSDTRSFFWDRLNRLWLEGHNRNSGANEESKMAIT